MPTVTTEAQLCNLALGLVGQRQFIDRLDENSTEAQVCDVFFAATRDEVLARFAWRFASRRSVLALTTETRNGWGFAYASPADLVVARYIWSGQPTPGAGQEIPFTKELNDAGDGLLILTDMEEAELVYTRTAPSIGLWPAHFVKAVAAQLAVYLAGALPVKPELMPRLQQAATQALLTAAAVDANEGKAGQPADSEFIRER